VIQFVRYSRSARGLIPKLERQIELESSGSLIFQLDSRPMTIPRGFREAYQKIFPNTYRRVYLNLTDKSKVSQALMEVFVEFIVHEEGFEKMEDHHVPLLNEIIDRTCARFNGQKLGDYTPADSADAEVPDIRTLRLGEDVLNSVEQELLKLVRA
jgi:hypothetical protein